MANYSNCFEVSAQCPDTASALGYTPSLPANVTLLGLFTVLAIVQLIQGAAWKTWGFMIALMLGSTFEITGYFGRLILNTNAWSSNGLLIQDLCLEVGPIFYSIGVFLCYTNLVESFRPTSSRLPLKLYPLISFSINLLPFALQASGSIIATNAVLNGANPKMGADLIMAGLGSQIFTMLLLGIMCLEFGVRTHVNRQFIDPATKSLRSRDRFTWFWVALLYVYMMLLFRCVNRIIELSGGFEGALARNETNVVILEGGAILIGGYAMVLVHPGYAFRAAAKGSEKVSSDDVKGNV